MFRLKKIRFFFFNLFLLLGCSLSLGFSNLFSTDLPSEQEFVLDLNEIKRGDILQSRTRVGGDEMIYFNLEVLSVSYNSSAKNSTILAEIRHPYFRENGVLSGMSGSPVYFEDRLVGAIAFTSSFLKKPIVGITHIKTMLTIFDASASLKKNESQSLEKIATPISIDSKIKLQTEQIKNVLNLDNAKISFFSNSFAGSGGSEKEKIPIKEISTEKKVTSSLDESDSENPSGLVPGDLIGVNLVRGDINISAYGTVTYIKGDKLLAFGHPMNHTGISSLSMYKAFTDAVVPLQTVSYKVGSLVEEIGIINQDRASGIAGIVGEKARYVPVTISLETPINNELINFEVIDDESVFIGLTSYLVGSSYLQFEDRSQPLLVETDLTIETDYKDKKVDIKNQNVFLNTVTGLGAIQSSLATVLNNFRQNRFEELAFKKINFSLKVKNDIDYLFIKEAETFNEVFSAGQEVDVILHLERYRKAEIKKTIKFKLPQDLTPGEYRIFISSESERNINEFLSPQLSLA